MRLDQRRSADARDAARGRSDALAAMAIGGAGRHSRARASRQPPGLVQGEVNAMAEQITDGDAPSDRDLKVVLLLLAVVVLVAAAAARAASRRTGNSGEIAASSES